MNHAEEVSNILKDLKAVLGPQGVRMVDKISAHMDKMTGEIEALKYANSLDMGAGMGGGLAAMPEFRAINFTPAEYAILAYIVGRGDNGASYDGMYAAAYSHRLECDQPQPEIIKVHICKIRKKLREAGLGCSIKSAWGRGYTFVPDPSLKRRDTLFISDHSAAA